MDYLHVYALVYFLYYNLYDKTCCFYYILTTNITWFFCSYFLFHKILTSDLPSDFTGVQICLQETHIYNTMVSHNSVDQRLHMETLEKPQQMSQKEKRQRAYEQNTIQKLLRDTK